MIKLSVIICAYNSRRDYLYRVLDALRNQTLPQSEWEILLIDNMSREQSKSAWDAAWHPNVRHILGTDPDITGARQRAIREAAGDLLIFIDDNHVLDSEYLAEAINIGSKWHRLGAWGSGAISLEFESKLPRHVEEYSSILGARDTKAPCWSNVFNCIEAIPSAAGICMRKNVAVAYSQFATESDIHNPEWGRNCFITGDDDAISYSACRLQLGVGIFPQLKQSHLIPKEQATEDYLLECSQKQNVTRHLMLNKWQGTVPMNPFSLQGFLIALKKFLLCRGFQRRLYLADLRAMLKARRVIASG